MARILGNSDLNFPNSDAVEIHGPRSVGADKAVAAAVEAARTFVEAGGKNQDSIYIGVSKDRSSNRNPWRSQIAVSSKRRGTSNQHVHMHACTHAPTRTHARTHSQINYKIYRLGSYAVEADAAAARDLVAKVLRFRLNFKKPRKITGQRSKGADQKVADAVKVANALMLGNYNGVWGV